MSSSLSRRGRLGVTTVAAITGAALAFAAPALARFGVVSHFPVDPAGAAQIGSDAAGDVYVAGSDQYIRKFSREGALLATFAGPGNLPGQFTKLGAIDAAPDGTAYAVDFGDGRERVVKFDATGKLLNDNFAAGAGFLATDYAGNVYLTGATTTEYSPQGDKVRQFTSSISPLAVDTHGRAFQYEAQSNSLTRLSPTGKLARWLIEPGDLQGQISSEIQPTGIAVDSNGGVWLADPGNNRIEEFNSDTGEFKLSCGRFYAFDMSADEAGDLFVASGDVYRLGSTNVTAPCEAPAPPTVTGLQVTHTRFRPPSNPRTSKGLAVTFSISRGTRVQTTVFSRRAHKLRQVGQTTVTIPPGSQTLHFNGWVSGKRLGAGGYTLRFSTRDAATKRTHLITSRRIEIVR